MTRVRRRPRRLAAEGDAARLVAVTGRLLWIAFAVGAAALAIAFFTEADIAVILTAMSALGAALIVHLTSL